MFVLEELRESFVRVIPEVPANWIILVCGSPVAIASGHQKGINGGFVAPG
jgi:hypothetical protein